MQQKHISYPKKSIRRSLHPKIKYSPSNLDDRNNQDAESERGQCTPDNPGMADDLQRA